MYTSCFLVQISDSQTAVHFHHLNYCCLEVPRSSLHRFYLQIDSPHPHDLLFSHVYQTCPHLARHRPQPQQPKPLHLCVANQFCKRFCAGLNYPRLFSTWKFSAARMSYEAASMSGQKTFYYLRKVADSSRLSWISHWIQYRLLRQGFLSVQMTLFVAWPYVFTV